MSRIEEHIRSLSDDELVDLVNKRQDDYTEEALQLAQDEISRRGGREALLERRRREAEAIRMRRRKHIEDYQERKRREASGSNPETRHIIVTTEVASPDLKVDRRLAIVSSEAAIGLNMLKDLLTIGRDLVGGRSKTIQSALADAKEAIIEEMRQEAHELGADAIVGVDLKYNEISSGRSILLVVGIGTAVTLG